MKKLIFFLTLIMAILFAGANVYAQQNCTATYSTGVSIYSPTPTSVFLPSFDFTPKTFTYHSQSGFLIVGGDASDFNILFTPTLLNLSTGPYSSTMFAQATRSIFLTFIDTTGTATTFTIGQAFSQSLTDIQIAPNGDLYLLGTFNYYPGGGGGSQVPYTTNLCPRLNGVPLCTAMATASALNGTSHTFLMRFAYNSSGFSFGGLKTFNESQGLLTANTLAFDSQGNPVIAGNFTGSVNFDSTTMITSSDGLNSGYGDAFILKLNAQTGNAILARSYGIPSVFDSIAKVVSDSQGNVRFIGEANNDILLGKIDSSNILSGNSFGSSSLSERGRDIVMDPNGQDFYITGEMFGPVNFDPGPGGYIVSPTTPAPSSSVFLVKYGPALNVLWGTSFGSTVTNIFPYVVGSVFVQKLAIDSCGYLTLAGSWENAPIQFDPSNTYPSSIVPNYNFNDNTFVSVFDLNGNWFWTNTLQIPYPPNPPAVNLVYIGISNLVPFPIGHGTVLLGSFTGGTIFTNYVTSGGPTPSLSTGVNQGPVASPVSSGYILYFN